MKRETVYNLSLFSLLVSLAVAGRWLGARVDDPDGVLALAAFSSIFKLVGVLALYPWLDGFARFIERISGRGTETAVSHLDPVLAEAGGSVALEAAWRATLELARDSVDERPSRFALLGADEHRTRVGALEEAKLRWIDEVDLVVDE